MKRRTALYYKVRLGKLHRMMWRDLLNAIVRSQYNMDKKKWIVDAIDKAVMK